MKYSFICLIFVSLISCREKDSLNNVEVLITNQGHDSDTSIFISKDIIIDNRITVRDSIFNYNFYVDFLKKLINSNRFIFVPLNEFDQTYSSEKIVIGLRHDVDYNIGSFLRLARREYEVGVRATYFFLNTGDYYSDIRNDSLIKKTPVLLYMKKMQNEYKHEIGLHNDLVTLQVVYNIDVKKYLTDELLWMRSNGINISGTSYHGSGYCYTYHYLNFYIWKTFKTEGPPFENYDSAFVDGIYKKINKFELSDFGLKYEASLLKCDNFFADVFFWNDKRWNMGMVDWNSMKPGTRFIILTHATFWD